MATFTWLGGSGNWTDSNWSISGPSAQPYPTTSDVAFLNGTGSYVVTISAPIGALAHDATLNDPNATLSVSATFVLGGGLTISQGTLTISTFNVLIFPQTLTNDGTILSTGLGAFSSLFDTSRGFTNNGTMSIDGDSMSINTLSSSFINAGSISVADFGVLTITENAVFDNSGLITLASGADLHLSLEPPTSPGSTSGNIQFLDNSNATLTLTDSAPSLTTTVEDFRPGNIIDMDGTLVFDGSETAVLQSGNIVVSKQNSTVFTIPVSGIPANATFAVTNDGSGWAQITMNPVACMVSGTRIRTPRGDVPVEMLAVGDLVRARFAGDVPITWIGCRRVDCSRHEAPERVRPVRVLAGAFGDDLPVRDLLLSPDHAVFTEGVLIPVKYLVNGVTVLPDEAAAQPLYFHVELDAHDILWADGLPVESLIPRGDRSAFENGGALVQLHPDFHSLAWEAEGCAPLVVTGPRLDATRARLAAQVVHLASRVSRAAGAA